MDSFKKRYFYKLISNLLNFVLSFATAGIVPKSLGSVNYGNFSYITNFFNQIISLFSGSTLTFFYTRFSVNSRNRSLYYFYLIFIVAILVLLYFLIKLVELFYLNNSLWPSLEMNIVYLAFSYAFLMFISNYFDQLFDAIAFTVQAEKIKIFFKILGTISLLLLYYFSLLNLKSLLIFFITLLLFQFFIYTFFLKQKGFYVELYKEIPLNKEIAKSYFSDLYLFSTPILVTSLFSIGISIGERWILQYFSGSKEQAYFSISFVLASFCSTFTGAMTPLVMREMAIHHDSNNKEKVSEYLVKHLPFLYVIASYFSCFVFFQTDTILDYIGGIEFKSAMISAMIMSFHAIHQTYGQINGSVFVATNRTKLYSIINVISMIFSLLLTCLLVLPEKYFCLNLGSLGISLKTVLINIISVNVLLFLNCKYLNIKFKKFIVIQITPILLFLVISWVSKILIKAVFPNISIYFQFFISGVLYSLISLGAILNFSKILFLGLDQVTLLNIKNFIKKKFRYI